MPAVYQNINKLSEKKINKLGRQIVTFKVYANFRIHDLCNFKKIINDQPFSLLSMLYADYWGYTFFVPDVKLTP